MAGLSFSGEGTTTAETAAVTSNRCCSVPHQEVQSRKATYLSFDIENGGEHCRIVQISGELLKFDLVGDKLRSDKVENIRRNPDILNLYVNSDEGAV